MVQNNKATVPNDDDIAAAIDNIEQIPVEQKPPDITRLPTLDFTEELLEEVLLLFSRLDKDIMPMMSVMMRNYYFALFQDDPRRPLPAQLSERLTLSFHNYVINFVFSLARDAVNDAEDAFALAAQEEGLDNIIAPEGV